ncbi:hypothetical protein [Shouchella clausii]|uniref:hypothetical protein n=1 Tax=Shouchella clausii TaxID=79880 RepID=UPI001C735846|nr:hypothetical protein [Shouchella clausii]MBX0320306.1 hypothetical protein [Shouchella clausii]
MNYYDILYEQKELRRAGVMAESAQAAKEKLIDGDYEDDDGKENLGKTIVSIDLVEENI